MNKYMRLIVFFDLPVKTKSERRCATQFRNFLIKDGYYMIQYSVYCRVCNGYDAVDKHKARLSAYVPDNGSVRLLTVTERQYEKMEILLGNLKVEEDSFACEQLTFF